MTNSHASANPDRSNGPDGPVKLTLRKKLAFLGILAGFFIVLFAAAELAVRIREKARKGTSSPWAAIDSNYRIYEHDPYLRFRFKPDLDFVPGYNRRITTNSLGYRGSDEYNIPKPDNVFRIACLGGSTTFGTGPENIEDTWVSLLQKRLREEYAGKKIEVMNAGVPGFNSFDSLINYQTRICALEADLVIIYHGINDIQALTHPRFKPDYSHLPRLGFAFEDYSAFRKLLCNSLLFVKMQKEADRAFGGLPGPAPVGADLPDAPPPADDIDDARITIFRRNLHDIVASVRANGGKCMLATFARAFPGPDPGELADKYRLSIALYCPHLTFAGFDSALTKINASIAGLAAEMAAPLADCAGAVPAERNYFASADAIYDLVHFSPEGSRKMADCFYREIENTGILKED